MEYAVDPLERAFVLDVDPVVGLVVVLHGPAVEEVLRLPHGGQRKLAQLRLFHLLDDDPVRADRHGGLALLQLHVAVVVLATALLLLPLADLALALPERQKSQKMSKKSEIAANLLHT